MTYPQLSETIRIQQGDQEKRLRDQNDKRMIELREYIDKRIPSNEVIDSIMTEQSKNVNAPAMADEVKKIKNLFAEVQLRLKKTEQ